MNKRGFTLVEIIVSTAIFTIVVTIAIGALTSLNKVSREARATRVIIDNANSAIDSMARTIRMGIRFDGACVMNEGCICGGRDDPAFVGDSPLMTVLGNGGNSCLKFYGPIAASTVLSQIRYRYSSANKSVERSQDSGASWQRMTAPEVEVSSMQFYVNGSKLGGEGIEGDQPVVTMVMTGVARVSTTLKPFSIQTTIAPRTPNLNIITPN